MKNLTTATAVTSNGQPRRPGSRRPPTATSCRRPCPAARRRFSNPLLFNNIFWDNRAGTRAGTTVTGHRPHRRRQPDRPLGPRRRRRHGPARADQLGRPAGRGEHPYTTSPTNSAADPPVVSTRTTSRCRSRPGGRTRPSSTRPWSPSRRRRTSWATTTSAAARPRRPATSGRPSAERRRTRPTTDIDDQLRPAWAGSTPAPTSSAARGAAASAAGRAALLLDRREHQPAGRHRHGRRRRHLHAGTARATAVIDVSVAPYNVPASAPTSTASPGWTPPTSTSPSPAT